jgi:hypothetical protein
VARDHQARPLVAAHQQPEEETGFLAREGQVAELVEEEDPPAPDHVDAYDAAGDRVGACLRRGACARFEGAGTVQAPVIATP